MPIRSLFDRIRQKLAPGRRDDEEIGTHRLFSSFWLAERVKRRVKHGFVTGVLLADPLLKVLLVHLATPCVAEKTWRRPSGAETLQCAVSASYCAERTHLVQLGGRNNFVRGAPASRYRPWLGFGRNCMRSAQCDIDHPDFGVSTPVGRMGGRAPNRHSQAPTHFLHTKPTLCNIDGRFSTPSVQIQCRDYGRRRIWGAMLPQFAEIWSGICQSVWAIFRDHRPKWTLRCMAFTSRNRRSLGVFHPGRSRSRLRPARSFAPKRALKARAWTELGVSGSMLCEQAYFSGLEPIWRGLAWSVWDPPHQLSLF